MSTNTPILSLPEWQNFQTDFRVLLNQNLRVMEALAAGVINATTTAPPGSPTEGATYIIAATATGAWAGRENQIAIWLNGGWFYVQPAGRWVIYNHATSAHLKWNGSVWA